MGQAKRAGVKLHNLFKVREKIGQAVVAGIGMVHMLDSCFFQLRMQRGCALFEAVVIVLAAVEINGDLMQASRVVPGKKKWVVFVPMLTVNRISENGCQYLAQLRSRLHRDVEFVWRIGD